MACASVLLVSLGAAARVQEPRLPDGEGRDVVVKVCTACHGAAPIANVRHTEKEWRAVVDDMITQGAEVTDQEVVIVVQYLTKHFGEASVRAMALAAGVATLVAAGPADWYAPAGRDFPLVGGNWPNQRYSALDRINRSNVRTLGGAWTRHLEEGGGSGNMQATPIVVNGVMFITSGAGNVFALDAKTGAIRWTYRSEAKAGNMTNRGVVVAGGKVFAGQRDNTLVALDEKTGAQLWKTELAASGRGYTPAPTVYYDGLVYIGVAGGEGGVRGQFGAYDAGTGKEVWKFWTLPGPGSIGHDTWEKDSWKYGGGPIWTHPAIDPALGTIYIAVGNAGPDNDGTERGGDDLFTASIVALDLKTGAYKWHFQEVHHDLWDYDNSASPLLADVSVRGRMRKAIVHAAKLVSCTSSTASTESR